MVYRSQLDRARVMVHAIEGCSNRAIANFTGFPQSFVKRWAKRGRQHGLNLSDLPRTGRPRKLTANDVKRITKLTEGKRYRSCRVIAQKLRRTDRATKISKSTIHRYWRNEALRPFHPRKVTRLNENHKLQWRKFARNHRIGTNWSNVMFVDEKQFNRYANINNKNDIVWAYSAEAVPEYEIMQHGPQLMVWGGMCSHGTIRTYTHRR